MSTIATTKTTLFYNKCLSLLTLPAVENTTTFSHSNFQKIENKWISSNGKAINFLFPLEEFQYELSKKNSSFSRVKEYKKILTAKQKLSLFYGYISTKKFKKIMHQASTFPGYFAKNFFSLLEQRVDVVLYRSGLVNSILTARQLCLHGKVLLNSQVCYSPSTSLKPGDILSIPSFSFSPKLKSEEKKEKESNMNFSSLNKYKKRQLRSFSRCYSYLNSFQVSVNSKKTNNNNNSNLTNLKSFQFLLQALKIRTFKRNEIFLKSISSSINHSYSQNPKLKSESLNPQIELTNKAILPVLKSNSIFQLITDFCTLSPLGKKQLQYQLKKKELEFKKENKNTNNNDNTNNYKPLNLEVSPLTATIVYLYSPQRLQFPFTIDIDILKKLNRI